MSPNDKIAEPRTGTSALVRPRYAPGQMLQDDDLTQAVTTIEQSFRTPGAACAGLLALIGRYTQLVGCAAVVGLVFSWPAAAALVAATMVFRKGQRGGAVGLARHGAEVEALAHERPGDGSALLACRARNENRSFTSHASPPKQCALAVCPHKPQ